MDPQRLKVLVQVAEALPPRCLEILILRKIEHLCVEEIVLRLSMSRRLVEKHLFRALRACEFWLTHPSTTQGLYDRAAEWTLRVDAGACSEMEWLELERWLSDDSAHRAAFEGAYRSWIELDEVAREVDSRAYAHGVSRRPREENKGWRAVATRLRAFGLRWFGRHGSR